MHKFVDVPVITALAFCHQEFILAILAGGKCKLLGNAC